MSYIIKKNEALINLKITNVGRKKLSQGSLTFSQFGLGDSEVDYITHDSSTTSILRPVDNNSDIMYPIASQSSKYIVPITNLTAMPHTVAQAAKERGFFNSNIEPNRVLNKNIIADSAVYIQNVVNDTADFIHYVSGSTYSPAVGHFILLKTPYSAATDPINTSVVNWDDTYNEFHNSDTVLLFVIKKIVTTFSNGYRLQLDRAIPNNPNFTNSVCTFYEGPDFIEKKLDNPNPITYWSDSVLGFDLNGVTTYDDVPIWNYNMVLIDDMIGLQSTVDKNSTQTKGKSILGTSILFGYYSNTLLDKIGVIHYTNNTVSNWYGEGFNGPTFKLDLPYILWHKQQFGGAGLGTGIGYSFICDTTQKVLNGKIRYYDLIDQEVKPTVVGKVFVDYKLCIVENPELLMAMSIKGNRNWTLPKPKLTTTEPGSCIGGNVYGSLLAGESLHVSYLIYDTNGVTPIHCNDFTTITLPASGTGLGTVLAKDIIFHFASDPKNPLYSEFPFLKDYLDTSKTGFKANRISIIWQKTNEGLRPTPSEWNIKDVTNYLGTTGCINQNTSVFDEFSLASETLMNFVASYVLTQQAIGELIIASNGLVKLPADSLITVSATNPYFYNKGDNTITFHSSMTGPTQIYYLAGKTLTSYARIQKYVTPSALPVDTYVGLYKRSATGNVAINLDYQPSNDVVYLFYNGQLISSNNYTVFNTGSLNDRRVELTFKPANNSSVMIYYVDAAGVGVNPLVNTLISSNFNGLRVFIDKDFLDNSKYNTYYLRDFINIPDLTTNEVTFGDEEFLLGNISTDINATIYKSLITCNVLPGQFVTSTNPTWNSSEDKVQFSEIGIYDDYNDLIAIGKFSQPLNRKYNSDLMVILATIDF